MRKSTLQQIKEILRTVANNWYKIAVVLLVVGLIASGVSVKYNGFYCNKSPVNVKVP